MTLITLYALFGDDVRVLATNASGDQVFWVINIICMVLFFLEILLASIVKPDYFLGFFFYLDLISTISLILDIGWVSNSLFGANDINSAASAAQLAKAGRTSRIGTRAGRIVRIVRLIRLVKLYKQAQQVLQQQIDNFQIEQLQQIQQTNLENGVATPGRPKVQSINYARKESNYRRQLSQHSSDKVIQGTTGLGAGEESKKKGEPKKESQFKKNIQKLEQQQQKQQELEKEQEIRDIHDELKHEQKMQKSTSQKDQQEQANIVETKLGQKLSDQTTKTVILIVLSIMISVPIFSPDTYKDQITTYNTGLSSIYLYLVKQPSSELYKLTLDEYIQFHKQQRYPVLNIHYQTLDRDLYSYINDPDIDNYKSLRLEEQYVYTLDDGNGTILLSSIIDKRPDNDLNAILSIVRTIFVCIVLTVGAILFSGDVELLVLEPIEKMVQKVERISKNPLEAAQLEEQETLALEQLLNDNNLEELRKMKEQEKYETVILEKLIIKIGALLAIGFGEAGSEIIASNMKDKGDVNPIIAGKKIMAIFGFCDIRNFTDATEVLQTGVMVFVNEIAEITHAIVDQHIGQANKNIGDAFLLVWKYQETDTYYDEYNQLRLKKEERINLFADMSVLAFLNVMAAIYVSKKLVKYQQNQKLNFRLHNYRVKMGFGLHVGWAIEGPIGSNYKIDASYLSPNVNMASRLEAATKQFGTNLLISGDLFEILTPKCQQQCRHIDRVLVKGSLQPMDLYTVDVHLENINTRGCAKDMFDFGDLTSQQKKKQRVTKRLQRNKLKNDINSCKIFPAEKFKTNKVLYAMRELFRPTFYNEWNIGFNYYIQGKWEQARNQFLKTLVMLSQNNFIDGPSNTLLNVIKENNEKCPPNWKGYRALTEK